MTSKVINKLWIDNAALKDVLIDAYIIDQKNNLGCEREQIMPEYHELEYYEPWLDNDDKAPEESEVIIIEI